MILSISLQFSRALAVQRATESSCCIHLRTSWRTECAAQHNRTVHAIVHRSNSGLRQHDEKVVVSFGRYDCSADIWSLGITLLEFALGQAPLQNCNLDQILMKTLNEPPPILESSDRRKRFTEVRWSCEHKLTSTLPSPAELHGQQDSWAAQCRFGLSYERGNDTC